MIFVLWGLFLFPNTAVYRLKIESLRRIHDDIEVVKFGPITID